MGKVQSKEGKKSKSKKEGQAGAETDDAKSIGVAKDANGKENGTDTAATATDSLQGTDSEDGDEGFSDEEATIFSKNKQTVTKDDFELLTVIGKGSFGKVLLLPLDTQYMLYSYSIYSTFKT